MLGNPLTFLGLVNAAPQAGSGVNSASSVLPGSGGQVDNSLVEGSANFADLVANGDIASAGIPSELIDQILVPDAQVGDGALVDDSSRQHDISAILDGNNVQSLIASATSVQIDQILSNDPSIAINQSLQQGSSDSLLSQIATDSALKEVAALTELAAPTEQSLDVLAQGTAIKQVSDAKADLSTIESVQNISRQLVNKNYAGKQDKRIFGQDNLQSFASGFQRDYQDRVNDLISSSNPFGIPKNSPIFDGDRSDNSNSSSIENKNFFFGSVENHFGKQADNVVKFSENKSSSFRESVAEAEYKIAHISKNNNVIDLRLEPASLGKVQIRLDFSDAGKANVSVFADKQDTLDILQKDSRALEKILQDSGIKADSGSLSFNLRGENGSGGYQQAQNDSWANSGSPFAFSLEEDIRKAVENVDYTASASSASLYRDNLAQGMLSILV